MNERGILEIAKATGRANIAPGYKLFTKEYLRKGRIVDLDSTHLVEIAKDGIFRTPFVFVAASEVSGGEPDIALCESEENALVVIRTVLEGTLNKTGKEGSDRK
jgi:hypothetical protein